MDIPAMAVGIGASMFPGVDPKGVGTPLWLVATGRGASAGRAS